MPQHAHIWARFTFYGLVFQCIAGKKQVLNQTEGLQEYLEYGDSLLKGLSDAVVSFTRGLERFNDGHFGKTAIAKWMRYDELKPNIDIPEDTVKGREVASRNMKKMGMAMLPIIFHVGASSTWMLITALMSFKSVALMSLLLIFKIAVSAAKVSAFFTHHYGHKEHIAWATPYHHHSPHGHEHEAIGHRSFTDSQAWDRTEAPRVPIGDAFQPMYSSSGARDPFRLQRDTRARIEYDDLDDKFSLLES